MAKINGSSFKLFIPTQDTNGDSSSTVWLPIAGSTSCTLNRNVETVETTTKDSSGESEFLATKKSWDVSFDGMVDFASSLDLAQGSFASIQDLFDYLDGRSTVKVAIGVEGADEVYWYGDTIVNNITLTADMETPVTYSGTLQGTGVLTKSSSATIDDASATYPEA
jgi:predicted secreted protein